MTTLAAEIARLRSQLAEERDSLHRTRLELDHWRDQHTRLVAEVRNAAEAWERLADEALDRRDEARAERDRSRHEAVSHAYRAAANTALALLDAAAEAPADEDESGAHPKGEAPDSSSFAEAGASVAQTDCSCSGHRCVSCDHLASHHSTAGCWYTVTAGEGGANLTCPCAVAYNNPRPVSAPAEAPAASHDPYDCPHGRSAAECLLDCDHAAPASPHGCDDECGRAAEHGMHPPAITCDCGAFKERGDARVSAQEPGSETGEYGTLLSQAAGFADQLRDREIGPNWFAGYGEVFRLAIAEIDRLRAALATAERQREEARQAHANQRDAHEQARNDAAVALAEFEALRVEARRIADNLASVGSCYFGCHIAVHSSANALRAALGSTPDTGSTP